MNTKNIGARPSETAKIKGKKITPFHAGFILGPRINAPDAGHRAHIAGPVFKRRPAESSRYCQDPERHNKERQQTQGDIVDEAMSLVEQDVNFNEQKGHCLKQGRVASRCSGIVASKITDKYYRPTVIISID